MEYLLPWQNEEAMICELWAIDAGAGEAVLRQDGQWLLLSIDRDWEALELEEAEVLRWALSGPIVLIGVKYRTMSVVVNAVRRACLEILKLEDPLPADSVRLLLINQSAEASVEEEESGGAVRRLAGRELQLHEMTKMYFRRLDRLFMHLGATREQAQHLRTETLYQFARSGRALTRGDELENRLFGLAHSIYLAHCGGRRSDKGNKEGAREEGRLWWLLSQQVEDWIEVLNGLNLAEEDLRCLALWSNPEVSFDYKEVGEGMRLPTQNVRKRIEQVASRVGRTPEQLRHRALHWACYRLLRGGAGQV
jgi:hypothetical protein